MNSPTDENVYSLFSLCERGGRQSETKTCEESLVQNGDISEQPKSRR